jgi:uncharacterized protein (TIGR02453 family)
MSFSGFSPAFFGFFRELRDNNEKSWFEANKSRYETQVKAPLQAFVIAMGPRLAAISDTITVDPKKSVFRIHRDTRFSKDKSPYKTNAGLHFRHESAKDAHAPGFYVHLAPDEVFYGGGLWMPEPPALAKLRDAIVADPKGWAKAKGDKGVAAMFGGLADGDPLTRPPKGYPAHHPHLEDLKKRSFFVIREGSEAEAGRADFPDAVAKAARAATPLMRFWCGALGVSW